jgi:hypothetical protein
MLDALKTCRSLLRKFFMTSCLLFTLGLRAGLPYLLLVFMIFFLTSPLLLGLFFVYSLCT